MPAARGAAVWRTAAHPPPLGSPPSELSNLRTLPSAVVSKLANQRVVPLEPKTILNIFALNFYTPPFGFR